jgi:hypothetical protein
MTEQAFASVWGLSYSDFEFLDRFGALLHKLLERIHVANPVC